VVNTTLRIILAAHGFLRLSRSSPRQTSSANDSRTAQVSYDQSRPRPTGLNSTRGTATVPGGTDARQSQGDC